MMRKDYQLFLHMKQGDDLDSYLQSSENAREALVVWASFMENNALILRRLADIFKDKELCITADTHYIGLDGDENALELALNEKLIDVDVYEDEYFDESDHSQEDDDASEKKERMCHGCERVLTFSDFFDTNRKIMSENEASEIWKNDLLGFYCCECVTKLECNKCGNKVLSCLFNPETFTYYCADCVSGKLEELRELMTDGDRCKIIEKIAEINQFVLQR